MTQHLRANPQIKVGQKAKTNLQPPQLCFRYASDLREPSMWIAQVLEGLHCYSEACEEQAVAVAHRDRDDALRDGKAVDVEGCCEVDPR